MLAEPLKCPGGVCTGTHRATNVVITTHYALRTTNAGEGQGTGIARFASERKEKKHFVPVPVPVPAPVTAG